MAKKKRIKTDGQVKYKQMTVEITFTDGEIQVHNFYDPSKCFRYIEQAVSEHYTDRVRIELF